MFDKEIEKYESVRLEYQQKIADKMGRKQWMEYNEILFSAHSCAIEGNSFTVDDTRILREQGMAMIPVGRSLLECTEIADHFRAFDFMPSGFFSVSNKGGRTGMPMDKIKCVCAMSVS
jgi:hypothetical protein